MVVRNYILPLILLMAFLVRSWGLDWGLPYLYHPDEPHIFNNVLQLVKGETLTKEFYYYPSLIFNIHTIIFKFLHTVSKITGCCDYQQIPSLHKISSGNGYIDNPTPFLVGRVITLFFSLGVVALVYLTLLTITNNLTAATLASLLAAFSTISVINARFITPDTYSGFFSMAVIFASVLILKKQSAKFYLAAGLLSGLAASSKYNAALTVLPVIMAHFLRSGLKGFKSPSLYVALFVFPVGFLIGSPQILFKTKEFMAGFQFVMTQYSGEYAGTEGNSLLFYLNTLIFRETVGFIFFVLALLLFRSASFKKELIIIGSFVIGYLFFISQYNIHFNRNLMPMMGSLFVMAGLGFLAVWKLFNLRYRLVATVGTVILLGMPIFQTIADTKVALMDDRVSAHLWIEENIPRGSRIVVESYGPWIDPQKYQLLGVDELIDHEGAWYLVQKIEYIVAAESSYGRYFDLPQKYQKEVNSYQYLFRLYKEIANFDNPYNRIRVFKR